MGNSVLVFHFSIRFRRRSCGNVGISPAPGEIPKGLVERVRSLPLASTLSTAPAFPQLSDGVVCSGAKSATTASPRTLTISAGVTGHNGCPVSSQILFRQRGRIHGRQFGSPIGRAFAFECPRPPLKGFTKEIAQDATRRTTRLGGCQSISPRNKGGKHRDENRPWRGGIEWLVTARRDRLSSQQFGPASSRGFSEANPRLPEVASVTRPRSCLGFPA